MRRLYAADLFAGAGGTSTGLLQAAGEMGLDVELVAVNHWDTAVESHAQNHPDARHLCASLDQLDPSKVIPRRKLDLLLASPECTHHSHARGGKPMDDQSRASAWHVLHWAERLRVENILVENVREFADWGPLDAKGKRPLKSRKGETFRAWVRALESLGYRVEWRILNCADHGDATTRKRLFVSATRRHGKGSLWPTSSHGQPDLFAGDVTPWRPAREVIDWTLEGESIFARKRPLAENTMRRIAEGLRRFSGSEPFLLSQQSGGAPRAVSSPTPTIAARGAVSLVQPFLVSYYGQGGPRQVDRPIGTLTTRDRYGLVQPQVADIRFRMLQPHELAAATSFPAGYRFAGTKADAIKQIGNAVPVRTARALCHAALRRRVSA